MSSLPLASIVITSYNYGRFLGEAIDSALGQSYPRTEVVVVDDGSTDDSREIIAGYAGRVRAILKENGGQASALNAGLAASRGDLLFFVDSDDALLPTAVERGVRVCSRGEVVKVHWPLWVIDAQGRRTGEVLPDLPLPEGALREAVLRAGADGYTWPPTTGNCWSRAFLERVAPLPEEEYRTCPDYYLAALAPLYGLVGSVSEPQGLYRIHGANHGWRTPVEERLKVLCARTDHCLDTLGHHCLDLGLPFDRELCNEGSWFHWLRGLYRASQELAQFIAPEDTFILVDQGQWETREFALPGLRRIPFPERDGQYWGAPADDETALREFERLRQFGARFMVFGWPAFWWLDYYAGFHRYLRARFRCLLENERLVLFDLCEAASPVAGPAEEP
jgi:glycosyltransferase involved in cell wall biosynthesis